MREKLVMVMSNLPGQFPMTIVNDYFEELQEHIEKMEKDLAKAMNHELGRVLGRFDGASEDLQKILVRLREEHEIDEKEAKKIAKGIATKTRNFSSRQVDKQVEKIVGIKPHTTMARLREKMNVFIQENVRLIKSIPEKYHDEVERVVREGVVSGQSTDEIRKAVNKAGNKTTNNAKLIARDQVGKFFGQTTKARHEQLGFERFRWRTVGDDRVRDSHTPLNGNVYTWEEGVDGLFPGMDIQCRCIALPVDVEVEEKAYVTYEGE